MPSVLASDDDDPIIASYDMYITNTGGNSQTTPHLLALQYPSHRPKALPYNAQTLQKPSSLQWKHETGLVEVEIPILTQAYYNPQAGQKLGQALSENRVTQSARSYGLAGGFNNTPSLSQSITLSDIPHHNDESATILKSQVLGGKIAASSERDPVYMLGVFRDDELHLSHLDAIVQMRPQLHHVDAEEELNQKRTQSSAIGKLKPGFELGPGKLETKAIELKLRDNKEDAKDRNLNENAKLLREIQRDTWQKYDWVDQGDELSRQKLQDHVITHDTQRGTQLQSLITNDDWLEKMSAPRQDGKKGLRSKLKGRDRERARRKKVENQKRLANAAATVVTEVSSDDSDTDVASDIELVDPSDGLGQDDIKQEPGSLAAAPEQVPKLPTAIPSIVSPPKRRGRPRKDGG